MYSVDIIFDDKSTDTIDYPTTDTQILTVEGDEAFVEMEDGSRVVAYEGSLTNLSVGDLVDCHYQAGAENGAWFRGRVASINSDSGTCDVVYYDREVSCFPDRISLIFIPHSFSNTWLTVCCIFPSMNTMFPSREQTCAELNEVV